MDLKNKHKTTRKKAQILKRKVVASAMSFPPLRMLVKNRRAVSAVVSNLILVAAVIVVGFAVLAWEQNQSATYQQNQSATINDNINQIQERLSFEYVNYNGTSLNVYIINSGTIDNVNVSSIQIGNNPQPIAVTKLFCINGTQVNGLKIGQDGYFSVRTSLPSGTNFINITTSRGSNFVTNFEY